MELTTGFALMALAVVLVVVTIACIVRKKTLARSLLILAFFAYGGVVIAITLFPLIIFPYPGSLLPDVGYNIVPFKIVRNVLAWYEYGGGWIGISPWVGLGGNIAMFVPLGVFLPLTFPKLRSVGRVSGVVFLATLAIEVAQLLLGLMVGSLYRCPDVDDLMLNFIGGMLGFALYCAGARIVRAGMSILLHRRS